MKSDNKLKMDLQMFGTKEPEPKVEEPIIEETKEPEVKEPVIKELEPKEPEVKEPKVEEPAKPGHTTEEMEELQRKLTEALSYKEKYEEAEGFKSKYEETQESLKGHEQTLEKIAQAKVEQIPEEFRELVPEGTTQERLEWISKAEASGLFGKPEPKSIGSSSRTNDHESSGQKAEDMTAIQKLASGIKDFYTK